MFHAAATAERVMATTAASTSVTSEPFIAALRTGDLFADPSNHKVLDVSQVSQMSDAYDRTLLGIVEVSARSDGRYVIIDGQHRWAVVKQVCGLDEYLVCRVHTGLSVIDEARLVEQIHCGPRDLTWWDRWRTRRSAGDPSVLTIDNVLAQHQLRINPAAEDGNIRATKALEAILGEPGDPQMLDDVLAVLTAAFGLSVDAFDGALMQGLALVIGHYDTAELDTERLIIQLQSIPPRQLRARAVALRQTHRVTVPRLCAAAIVERYNARRGRNIEPFLVRESAMHRVAKNRGCEERAVVRRQREGNAGGIARSRGCSPAAPWQTDPSPACTPPTGSGDDAQAGGPCGDIFDFDESPEVGVPDPGGIRRALGNGRGLRWVMDTYGLDYATVKGMRDEIAVAGPSSRP